MVEHTNVRTAVSGMMIKKKSVNKMDEKIYLFTTTRCPACPAAKNYVADNGLENKVEQILVDQSVDGMALAESFAVTSVPTFVIVTGELQRKLSLQEFMEWSA